MANDTTPTTSLGPDGRLQESIDTAKTLAAVDCGVLHNVKKSLTITLPPTIAGLAFTIRNACVAAGASSLVDGTVTIAPNASDKIIGFGTAATANKAIINAGKLGDEVQLIGNGVDGWNVVKATGNWTRQP